MTSPPNDHRWMDSNVSAVLKTAHSLNRLLSDSKSGDAAEVTREACRILAESTGAMAVALRSLTPDGFAHYEGGWASSNLLDGPQKALCIRDMAMFEKPSLTTRIDEMPIIPESKSDVKQWRHHTVANPQVLFCPIRTGGRACGYLTLVGSADLAWTDDLVDAVNLATSVIGQYQLRVWREAVQEQQLALTEYHRDVAASVRGLSSIDLEACLQTSLITLAQHLGADVISLWELTGENRADRTFRWHKPGAIGVYETDPTIRTPQDSPFAPTDPRQPVLIDGAEISADRAGQVYVLAPGAYANRQSVFLVLARPRRWPWQDWELAAIGAIADLVPMARNTCAAVERLAATFEDAPLGITVRSSDGELLDCNQAYLDFLGAESIDELDRDPKSVVATDQVDPEVAQAIVALDIDQLVGIDVPYLHRSGSTVWGRLSVVRAGAMNNEFFLTHVEDITDYREALATIRRRATTDSLTGLANRHQTIAALQLLLGRPGISQAGIGETVVCAAVVVDLDGFKEINDTHGHPAGDDVLVEVGRRLSSLGRSTDLIGRYGGDEFVVVFAGPITQADALRQVDRLKAKFDAPFDLRDGTSTLVGASIGASFARPTDTPDELLARADAEMYDSKFRARELKKQKLVGLGSQPTIDLRVGTWQRPTRERVELAIERDELTFWIQPIVDTATRAPIGVELLARWPQADGSMIGPATFVPVIEGNGLFVELGRRALREAAELLNRWVSDPYLSTLAVNVNISPAHLTHGLVEDVQALIPTLPPDSLLGLELIETELAHSDQQHLKSLEHLADRGIRVIIDDFGVGQSSLGRLRSFPATNLKIDKSFLDEITTDRAQLRFFRSVVRLLRNLGYPVTVEGVETEEVFELVKTSGAAAVQGFLIAKPTPSDRIDDVLVALHKQSQAHLQS